LSHLGNLINVDYHVISLWEKGKRSPNITSLKKLASVFNVSLDYIAGNSCIIKPLDTSNISDQNRIKELRLKRNITQFQLSYKIGVPPSHISKWESCKYYPGIENAIKLANYFDVSLDYLFPSSLSEDGEKQ
jgi:transcriptional regulator with XRE-family HTH domain